MAYTFGARLDDDSYALTTIDEDQGTASTKGEINGVPFEGGPVHQTYTGNVANIMSQIPNYSAFAEALFNGGAFARLTATLGADTATLTVTSNNGQIVQASLQALNIDSNGIKTMAMHVGQWGPTGTLAAFEKIDNMGDKTWRSTNYAPMASQVPCTLEVVLMD